MCRRDNSVPKAGLASCFSTLFIAFSLVHPSSRTSLAKNELSFFTMPGRQPTANIKNPEILRSRYFEPSGEKATLENITKPKFTNIDADEHWEFILPILLDNNVLQVSDLTALALMCELYGKIQLKLRQGKDPSTALLTHWSKLQSQFGLNPVDRSRISVKPKGKRGEVFKVIKPA